MHSKVYSQALINDEVQFIPSSLGQPISTYRGMATFTDDNLTVAPGVYLTVLFGSGAVGFGTAAPRTGLGTELWRAPGAGNGGGQTILYSRLNVAMAPSGYTWSDSFSSGGTTTTIAGESPSLSDLANPGHWTRATSQRKSIPLAFLLSKTTT